MISRSLWRSKPSLVSCDQITPDDTMTRRLEMSQRPGSASRARRIGLANASPTIDIELIENRSTVSSSSTASKRRPSIVVTLPPSIRLLTALKKPVPCISGAAGRLRGRPTRPVRRAHRGLVRAASGAGCSHRGRRTGRPGATSLPSACRWCRPCTAATGDRPNDPTARRRVRLPRRRPASYGTAHSGHGPDPSSTQIHRRTPGTRSRTASHCSTNVPWKITATASALVHR